MKEKAKTMLITNLKEIMASHKGQILDTYKVYHYILYVRKIVHNDSVHIKGGQKCRNSNI